MQKKRGFVSTAYICSERFDKGRLFVSHINVKKEKQRKKSLFVRWFFVVIIGIIKETMRENVEII